MSFTDFELESSLGLGFDDSFEDDVFGDDMDFDDSFDE